MDRLVRWTPDAATSLERITAYIAQDSPVYAAAFATRVLNAVNDLKVFPESGHVVPEFDQPDVREIPVRNHRVIYQLVGGEIRVLFIVHGSRDLSATWSPPGRAAP